MIPIIGFKFNTSILLTYTKQQIPETLKSVLISAFNRLSTYLILKKEPDTYQVEHRRNLDSFHLVGALPPPIFGRGGSFPHSPPPNNAYVRMYRVNCKHRSIIVQALYLSSFCLALSVRLFYNYASSILSCKQSTHGGLRTPRKMYLYGFFLLRWIKYNNVPSRGFYIVACWYNNKTRKNIWYRTQPLHSEPTARISSGLNFLTLI
ncbi:hypothetical protein AGLY_008365 [Aphis glycines]|uniref:Uncharacterized protein n=1 Tax=Aphis glycines TaxID=307491 RepID=A0A6G0TMV9_APHGL|nr:hypothetical protein AGLY_008365 [Aphis glycines]